MQYDFKAIEEASLKLWQEKQTYKQVKEQTKEGTPFYFLEGPPYTSGDIHIGHAWNAALKDMILRYKRMRGFNVWDRWGYDMHGLPTENKVQKKLGLKSKDEILKFGLDKFQKECYEFSMQTALKMNSDFAKLGLWVDFENAYMPIKPEFISGEWALIKKAHQTGRLYKGKKSMAWDKETETAHAKHELEYETVTDTSIYVKFKVKDKDEYLIIWTTTPWTIPLNLAVMVGSKIEYVHVDAQGEKWIVAKDLVESLKEVTRKELTIIDTFTGDKLEGVKYEHPLADKIPQFAQMHAPKVHSVVLADKFVETSSGTGLVHCAPGCGPEDYEVGIENGLEAFNTLNERGEFQQIEALNGLVARDDDDKFIDMINDAGALVAKRKYKHEYPHSWRSHKPVIFRTTEQWFLKVEDLREKLLEENKQVQWNPDVIKNSFERWIENLRDNALTRQRFWGCPVPIWEDEDGNIEVIGSLAELKEKAITPVPQDLHRPFIDEVKLKGPTGKEMTRIPDVLDVWIDSGTVSWNCLNYPQDQEAFTKYFPADLIIEGADQARLWFTMLQICSAIMFDKTAFKNVYSHGMILDFQGEKMSKSIGNVIAPHEVIDQVGADVFRYYVCENPAGRNMNFTWEEVKLKQRNMIVLWNLHKFVAELQTMMPSAEPAPLGLEEHYILSALNSTIKEVTQHYEKYELNQIIKKVETFFLDVSRTYVQLVRDKTAMGTDEQKVTVIRTLNKCLDGILRMLSTICPMTAEQMYQNLKEGFGFEEESIHLLAWPKAEEVLINKALEEEMQIANNILQAGFAAREKAHISLRWPVSEVVVEGIGKVASVVQGMENLLKQQLNTKEIRVAPRLEGVSFTVKPNLKTVGKKVGALLPKLREELEKQDANLLFKQLQSGSCSLTVDGQEFSLEQEDFLFEKTTPEGYAAADFENATVYVNKERSKTLEAEGYARELMRYIQQLRKEKGMHKSERIILHIQTSYQEIDLYSEHIADRCGADDITITENDSGLEPVGQTKVKENTFKIYFSVAKAE